MRTAATEEQKDDTADGDDPNAMNNFDSKFHTMQATSGHHKMDTSEGAPAALGAAGAPGALGAAGASKEGGRQ